MRFLFLLIILPLLGIQSLPQSEPIRACTDEELTDIERRIGLSIKLRQGTPAFRRVGNGAVVHSN